MKTSQARSQPSAVRMTSSSPARARPGDVRSPKRESIRTSGKRVRRQRTMRARGRA